MRKKKDLELTLKWRKKRLQSEGESECNDQTQIAFWWSQRFRGYEGGLCSWRRSRLPKPLPLPTKNQNYEWEGVRTMKCVVRMTIFPRFFSWRRSHTRRREEGSRPLEGSSRNRTGDECDHWNMRKLLSELPIREPARDSLLFWPPLSSLISWKSQSDIHKRIPYQPHHSILIRSLSKWWLHPVRCHLSLALIRKGSNVVSLWAAQEGYNPINNEFKSRRGR